MLKRVSLKIPKEGRSILEEKEAWLDLFGSVWLGDSDMDLSFLQDIPKMILETVYINDILALYIELCHLLVFDKCYRF